MRWKHKFFFLVHRSHNSSGIAIGPILFIIAILAVLAAAIAVGSGSFTTGTASDSSRIQAASIMDLGQNLKMGYERIIISSGIDPSTIVIDPNQTGGSNDLFSPLGGGITAPSTNMANDPANDVWSYPQIAVPNIGSGGTNYDQLAVLTVLQGTCAEINNRVYGNTTIPSADLGDWTVSDASASDTASSNWPAGYAGLSGCLDNTHQGISSGHIQICTLQQRLAGDCANSGGGDTYYFYQIINIQ